MPEIVIRAERLGKQYRIGGRQERYRTLREALVDVTAAPVRRARAVLRGEASVDKSETIWALRDVSFEVKHGEAVGIIGRNGAGKSTLLKILSRITEPTTGYADVYGRIGSLLEVGTGFHPELTGRENIYLNGAILGMRRSEIDRKFDEIVAFAEVEKFVDTAVKHYSSGMYLRLAFAVAAHLEPEILLVDEVLAVGDAVFQRKCVSKMSDVANEGRAVLFVSHNMGAIASLCKLAMVIESGRVVNIGESSEMISHYIQIVQSGASLALDQRRDRRGDGRLRFVKVEIHNSQGLPVESIRSGEDITVVLHYAVEEGHELHNVNFRIIWSDNYGTNVFVLGTAYKHQNVPLVSGTGHVRCEIPHLPIAEGEYFIDIACIVDTFAHVDNVEKAAKIQVLRGDYFGTGESYKSPNVYVEHNWIWDSKA